MKKWILWLCLLTGLHTVAAQGTWSAGTARVKITPESNLWMAGYAARTKPSDGSIHDLWAKALVLQDASGKKSLLITTDILGYTKAVSDRIRQTLSERHHLDNSQIILSGSHTHSGPVLENALIDIYPMDTAETLKVKQYTAQFEARILQVADAAMQSLQPVTLFSQNGIARFQVNRRNNNAGTILISSELKGPSDYAVPVIKVVNSEHEIIAIIFGYACHPTVLDGYQWSGDYPGFAQLELEKNFPNANALFFLGAAGDQNPLPRRSVPLAQQYGKELAAAVERVLAEDMKPLSPTLQTAYSEIDLRFSRLPTEPELARLAANSTDYSQRWAVRMLHKVRQKEPLMASYPYPIQAWHIGEQPLVSLGGEVTVEYALKIKELFGYNTFVLAYANDVMGYIPSLKVLREGGYEGETSQMVYGLPATWDASIESSILQEVIRTGRQAGFPTP